MRYVIPAKAGIQCYEIKTAGQRPAVSVFAPATPHFYAVYGEFEAFVAIETGDVIEGGLAEKCRSAGQGMDAGAAAAIARKLAARSNRRAT